MMPHLRKEMPHAGAALLPNVEYESERKLNPTSPCMYVCNHECLFVCFSQSFAIRQRIVACGGALSRKQPSRSKFDDFDHIQIIICVMIQFESERFKHKRVVLVENFSKPEKKHSITQANSYH